MAIPIINNWRSYFEHGDEGLGSSYERIILNNVLLSVMQKYEVKSVLESPSFGFTGLSGINLVALAKEAVSVHLEDHDEQRILMIKELWDSLDQSMEIRYNANYRSLDYPDKSFDLSFSFSALWFCQDLRLYLSELARVSKKCILISVPNRSGLGYQSQLQDYSPARYPYLKISHIDPPSFIYLLGKLGWTLKESKLFDCPLWPDIGMSKEDFIRNKLGIKLRVKEQESGAAVQRPPVQSARPEKEPLSILDYYRGKDEGFAGRMLQYDLFERHATQAFKRIWAHHEYFLFEPKQ
ncbi:MAG TPA: class I SAM-dependent methyltransferase [Candidatus Cloacimonetes bacterium]|jgi:hypothetical protein|nr:class I SAM-dependent methyltransferase [Candidatus Cloacimonadota bacterium]